MRESVQMCIRDRASLQLAHFLLSEDSEGLALVDELPASSSRRYETAARLESIFDYYRLTGRRLEALHLYLTDGTSYQLYTGLAVPQNLSLIHIYFLYSNGTVS